MVLVLLNLLLAIVAIVFALRSGGQVENNGAKLLLVMLAVALVSRQPHGAPSHELQPAAFGQDLIGFIGFSCLGIYSKRIWPLWAAAFQLLSVGAHGVMAFEIAVRPIVYAWMKSGPTWAVYLLLIAGTLGHRRRMRSSANARSWPG